MSYYPLLSIPVYTLLSIFPHVYAVSISSKGNPKRHDNRNPKASDHLAKVKSTLSPRDFARFERAESCHRNGLENMPLFVATILAGIYAQRETGVPLNTTLFAALWLLDRVLYTVNYREPARCKSATRFPELTHFDFFSQHRDPDLDLRPQSPVFRRSRPVLHPPRPLRQRPGKHGVVVRAE